MKFLLALARRRAVELVMRAASKGNKGETWKAKSIDVDPAQWRRVRLAAASESVEIRVWLKLAIAAALEKGTGK